MSRSGRKKQAFKATKKAEKGKKKENYGLDQRHLIRTLSLKMKIKKQKKQKKMSKTILK